MQHLHSRQGAELRINLLSAAKKSEEDDLLDGLVLGSDAVDNVDDTLAALDDLDRPKRPRPIAPPAAQPAPAAPAPEDPIDLAQIVDDLKLADLKTLARLLRASHPDAPANFNRRKWWHDLFRDAKRRINEEQRKATRRARDVARKRASRPDDSAKRLTALARMTAVPTGKFYPKLVGNEEMLVAFREVLKSVPNGASLATIANAYNASYGKQSGEEISKQTAARRRDIVAQLELPGGPWHRWK